VQRRKARRYTLVIQVNETHVNQKCISLPLNHGVRYD
jgi:hypothetical protein